MTYGADGTLGPGPKVRPRRAPGCRALVAGSGSLVAGSGSLPPRSVRKKILVYGVDGSRTRMRILVYEYLKASPRKRGLCDEVVRDGKAAQGQQPAGAVAAHAADGTADVPLRDGHAAAGTRQGPRHQDQLGVVLHGGPEPGKERLHRGGRDRPRGPAARADHLPNHRRGPG